MRTFTIEIGRNPVTGSFFSIREETRFEDATPVDTMNVETMIVESMVVDTMIVETMAVPALRLPAVKSATKG